MSVDMLMKSLDTLEKSIHTKMQLLPELADRLLQLEQKGSQRQEGPLRRNSLGASAWDELQKNADLLQKTGSLRMVVKAAADPVTTTSGRNIVVGGIGAPTGQVLGAQNALTIVDSGGVTALEYSRYTGVQGAAAQQATEGAAKAYVRADHTIITQKALTIAGLTKVSRQAMTDRAELMAVVETVLMREVGIRHDAILVNGGTDFTGGLETLATAYTSLLYTALVDAIAEGVATMQVAGFTPNVVVLNPADWLAVTVAKGSDLHYLSGAYLGTMPMEMRGLRVVLSPSIDAGKALLMDSTHIELRVSDQFTIEMAYSSDDFEKNLATMRGEMRVIPVFRSVGAARFITPKA